MNGLRLLLGLGLLIVAGGSMAQAENEGFKPQEIEILTATKTLYLEAIASHLISAKVVIVGEYHDAWASHQLQMNVLQQLNVAQPQQWAIGIEWLPLSSQPAIDDYLQDKTDDFGFLHASDYVNRWGFDARLVLPVLRYAKQQGLTVLALNAPKELTRQASKEGLESLTAEQRGLFPNPLLPMSQQYQTFLSDFFKQNQIPQDKMNTLQTVQAIWDQTMALSAWRFLQTHPTHKMLILTGMVHATKGQGIADALSHLAPDLTVLNMGNGDFEEFTAPKFDYFAILPALNLPKALTLGVSLQNDGDDLQIAEVSPEGLAAKLGLLPDDTLTALAGRPLKTLAELKIALWLASENPYSEGNILRWQRPHPVLDLNLPYEAVLQP